MEILSRVWKKALTSSATFCRRADSRFRFQASLRRIKTNMTAYPYDTLVSASPRKVARRESKQIIRRDGLGLSRACDSRQHIPAR